MKLYRDNEGDYWVGDKDADLAVFIGEDIWKIRDNFDRASMTMKRADVKYDLREVR